jgi:energy-converting hydrogenase Eha subunit H
MARLNTTEVTIKVSKLQKDNEDDIVLLTSETIKQLEAIIAELAGDGVLVEIEQGVG